MKAKSAFQKVREAMEGTDNVPEPRPSELREAPPRAGASEEESAYNSLTDWYRKKLQNERDFYE